MIANNTVASVKQNNIHLLIYLGFICVFLPYYVSFLFLIFADIYLFKSKRDTDLFKANKLPWLLCFVFYSAVIATFNGNFNGVIYSLFIFLLVYYAVHIKAAMTPQIFENSLELCCWLGLITSLIGIADKAIYLLSGATYKHRTTLYFFNCNYLATILAIVVIICAYKIILSKGKPALYFATAILCAVTMYFTGSMFVWIEVLVGIAFLLKFTRRNQLFCILLLAIATVLIVLYCAPEIIPRFDDFFKTINNRIGIWKISLLSIKNTPVFGRGFMTYKHIIKSMSDAYPTSHSHNIILEALMDFGILGTAILSIYILKLFKRLFLCRNAQSKYYFSSLIIALLFGLIAHGTTDLTFIWSQTGLFYGLLLCGLGPEEKLLNI